MLFKKKKKKEEDFEVDAYETNDEDEIDNDFEDDDEEEEEEKAPLVKTKKQKKTSPVLQKNPLHSYKFWFKIFGAVLLIILGFFLLFRQSDAQIIVLMFTGGVFSLYAVMRVVPLMRTMERGWSRVLCFIEVLFDLAVGILLITLSVQQFGDEQTGMVKYFVEHYNILIGVVLWLRGFVYFTTTILFGEKTDRVQFFVHIAVITFGAFLLGVKIDAKYIAIAIAIISFVCGVAIGGEGFYDYGKYRKRVKEIREKKEPAKEKTKGKEAPSKKKKKEKYDEPKRDVPPVTDEDNDRPYVS